MNQNRISSMLIIYGNKSVRYERERVEKLGESLTPHAEQYARHMGECSAWVEHDSRWGWKAPLENSFTELREYIKRDDPYSPVEDWNDLRILAAKIAVNFLSRMHYPPLPAMLSNEHEERWWMLMAIVHECDRQMGELFPCDTVCPVAG